MLSVKQEGIKYHFKSLWYDVTWDWTQVSQTISEHSTHLANEPVIKLILWNNPHIELAIDRLSSGNPVVLYT